MSENKNNTAYTAQSIKIMEGLEAVRKRPAMYIGSTGSQGLHHLVYEIVDNSVDEALAGHCNTINVILHQDGSCSVEDNGRGIPTDIHPQEGVSAAEVVLTKLHAGGKFDKDTYKYSGGLHGVGVSVVNALSKRLNLTIFQNGNIYEMAFERGKPVNHLSIIGQTSKRGTLVHFWPDETIFQETLDFSFDILSARLRELAFLNKGLKISISDERTNKHHEFYFEGGIVSFVEELNKKKNPIFNNVLHFDSSDNQFILEVALQYNEGFGEQVFSFVNNINTVDGGTHVAGFKSALTKICNKRATDLGVLKENESFSSEDVREGLVAVISMKVPEPQFEGQTKTKLGNSEIKGIVDSWSFSFFDTYFEENPSIARQILQKAELAKRAREAAKKARDLTRRKTVFETAVLPGKLADCTSENPSETELFIVEGESAGGSAKQGRDRFTQAILPLKGKILNVEKARLDKVLGFEEIKSLVAAIGCGIDEEFDIKKARYHKIILMTDADVDGSHIRTLLLTFFFRYMKPLVEQGYLYIAQPPLYKAKLGKKEQYLKNEHALQDFLFDWALENTKLITDGSELSDQESLKTLEQLKIYERILEDLAIHYKLPTDGCHQLLVFKNEYKWNVADGIDNLIHHLQKKYSAYQIKFNPFVSTTVKSEDEPITLAGTLEFVLNAKKWQVPVEFFTYSEPHEAEILLKSLLNFENSISQVSVNSKDRKLSAHGVLQLINAIKDAGKPYMSIQRYKGLGEMNPEQLWETSMDKNARQLLQVTIQDALEADNWFTTLMGDNVQGRREFIEENGRFVKNLDI
jgi:DNA gyrase subunit B